MRSKAAPDPVARVTSILEGYAAKAIFRGFSKGAARGGRTTFKMTWHRDRLFELVMDTERGTLRFPALLPDVPPRSPMNGEFRQFLAARQAAGLPAHRRIDPAKARLESANRGGSVSLTMTALDLDWDYATKKLIHLAQETYMVFLMDGRYYDYLIETFDLDPDHLAQ